MSLSEHVVQDYASLGLSLKAHPVSFVRDQLAAMNILSGKKLVQVPDGARLKIAGLVLVRQRPGTAGGVCFMTIEDETGCANLVVFEKLFTKYRKEVLQSKLLMVEGKLQREGEVVHVIVQRCHNLSSMLRNLNQAEDKEPGVLTLSRADEKTPPYKTANKRTQIREQPTEDVFYGGRNFR